LAIKAEKGYLILAVNSESCDYIALARRLCKSIKSHHPAALVCLLTDQLVNYSEFDFVELLPYGNQGGWANDWQVWSASPFRETIKLESDMLIASEIDHWWTIFRNRDVVVSTGAKDFYDQLAISRYYRNIFDSNSLPDVYNAVTYWRVSQTAQRFWLTVRTIFSDWNQYKTLIKFAPDRPDTDLVYAMAAVIVGKELVTLPDGINSPKIVHMKQHIIPTHSKNWTKELVWENVNNSLRINTIAQWGCFHYYIKDWNISE
jgi:hypothetical protein